MIVVSPRMRSGKYCVSGGVLTFASCSELTGCKRRVRPFLLISTYQDLQEYRSEDATGWRVI